MSAKGLNHSQITIVVVVVLAVCILIVIAITVILKRRTRNKPNLQFLSPELRGGRPEDQEVDQFMNSGLFDGGPYRDSGHHSRSSSVEEEGYATISWQELPRTLQPAQANTAMPEHRPSTASSVKSKLEATSARESTPAETDRNLRPAPFNFSRPLRDHVRGGMELKADEYIDFEGQSRASSRFGVADPGVSGPNRVSSPTLPALLPPISFADIRRAESEF